ncbi:hypothetical protein BCR42DRAFT_401739 [Absidia repens]|uniref:SET domain-containing protein n=1 Tax=Absidia repens TaxID=90262 RepID=A0A1X2J2W2_9FUNG|nr:hypothetical protein BCR42DRAFT_401739 [Absidia repens]
MAFYTTPSVDNTSTINDSLTANHHIQPEKRPTLMDNDYPLPTKRKRVSMTFTEPNTMNNLMPSSCSLQTYVNESTTTPIIDQTSAKSHTAATATTLLLQPQVETLPATPSNILQQQVPLVTEEIAESSQEQKPSAISSPSPVRASQPPPTVDETAPSANVNISSDQDSLPVTAPGQEALPEGRSKRIRKPVEYNVKLWETFKQVTPRARSVRMAPRWYTQSYLMFLALREHPGHCLSRSDLINAALALDKKISKERNLPRVFRSKTPMNSASAILTTNADRYYISYKPEGSRSLWFRLAYTPGNFDHAYGEYRKWMDKLINHDWLYCFGVPLENSTPMTLADAANIVAASSTSNSSSLHTVFQPMDDNDNKNDSSKMMIKADTSNTTAMNNSDNPTHESPKENSNATTTTTVDNDNQANAPPKENSNGLRTIDNDNLENGSTKENSNNMATTHNCDSTHESPKESGNVTTTTVDDNHTREAPKENSNVTTTADDDSKANGSLEENSNSTITTAATDDDTKPTDAPSTNTKLDQVQHQPMYQLDQLDLDNVPKKWQDIVKVDTSTIPNSGQGLFAVRELPYNTPLGFYFGVPMTEYEFDSIKENVGRASEYSIKYRKTILDATDDQGEPYTLKNASNSDKGNDINDEQQSQLLCPFHYMNEAKDEAMANILFVEGVVVNQVICWSKRLILPGEELLVWYGTDVNRYWKDNLDQQTTS